MSARRVSLRTLLVWAAAAVAIAALVVFGLAGSRGQVGHPAPPLPSEHLAGQGVTLADLRGHPALVTFWASWCDPCAREASALERFSQSLDGRARLIGVDWTDSRSGALSFVKRYDWTFPNLRDPQGATGLRFGLADLPTTFVINSEGRVQAMLRGPQTEQTLDRALAVVRG